VGLFDEDRRLCGVAAWRIYDVTPPVLCRSDIVAVAVREQRQGLRPRAEGCGHRRGQVSRRNRGRVNRPAGQHGDNRPQQNPERRSRRSPKTLSTAAA
jgi:hypothetical protein